MKGLHLLKIKQYQSAHADKIFGFFEESRPVECRKVIKDSPTPLETWESNLKEDARIHQAPV